MKRLLLSALVALSFGCATAPAKVGERAPYLQGDAELKYQETFSHYSDHAEVYALFDTRAFFGMTYEAPAFREARTQRVATFQQWPPALLQQKVAEEKAAAETGHQFYMGVHMNDRHYEDFDKKDSVWRIALVTPTGEVTPITIERLGRSTLDIRAIYPYMDDFWVGYLITFPKTLADGTPTVPPGTTELRVRVASTLGKAEMKFPAE